jgi:hypothetical protein
MVKVNQVLLVRTRCYIGLGEDGLDDRTSNFIYISENRNKVLIDKMLAALIIACTT